VAAFAALSAPAAARTHLWSPGPRTTWQWQIVGHVKKLHKVDMYDVDLTDAVPSARAVHVRGFGNARFPKGPNAGIIHRLHRRGIAAVCYMDSGAWESYEPDAGLFPKSVIGNSTGWSGERWLDIRRRSWPRFAPIIWARFKLARAIGCDGVEPDENNPLGNRPGFPISRGSERAWYLKVAREAHSRGLSVGMKNGVEVLDGRLAKAFDWSLNEECFFYSECGREMPFIRAGKAVFQTEYTDDWRRRGRPSPGAVHRRVCAHARARSFSTLVKRHVPDALFNHC
jgi:hypothetical protein